MSKETTREYLGPHGKVELRFTYDEERKADSLRIVLYDENNKQTESIVVGTRVSPLDKAVLMLAIDSQGNEL